MWFDTHAHLCDSRFDEDRSEALERAWDKGVRWQIEIADGPDEWEKAKIFAEQHPGRVWWAGGVHPYYQPPDAATWETLRQHTRHPQFVAIGEVGLDYAKSPVPKESQRITFSTALDLAAETDKPLVIHCRDAYSDLVPMLSERYSGHSGRSPGVVHCFSGNKSEAEKIVSLGFYLGIDGPLTYPNSHGLREALSEIPLEKLVLETDSPYLPPQAFRGKRNEPSYLPLIGESLSGLRRTKVTDLARLLTQNGQLLFRLESLR